MRRRGAAIAACVLACCPALRAESVSNGNGWYNYFGKFGLGGGWSWWTELQARRNEQIVEPQQYLIRTALYKKVRSNLELGGGYGFIRTDPYGKRPVRTTFDENRIYQDAIWDLSREKWRFTQRFRWEQRWLLLPQGNTFTQRFRYRMMVRRPIGSSKDWYWTAGDEIMFNVSPNLPPNKFDQNRAMALIGRSLKSGWRVEMGFQEQTLLQRNGRILEHNHTIMVNLFAPNWALRK